MKNPGKLLLAAALLVVSAVAQEQRPSGNDVPGYNAAQEVTVSGTVEEIKNYQCPVSGTIGSHISIKSGADTVEVHLAPATYLKQYDIAFKPGDQVKITGMKFVFGGKPAMIARVVVDAQSTFTFRDGKGRPEW